jgi:hypothetical protein
MAITPNTTFTSGQILTAQQQNNFPRGVMASITTNGTIGTITTGALQNVTGMSLTFTAVAGRTYKFCVQASTLKNTTASWTLLTVTNSAGVQSTGSGVYASALAGEYANLSFSNFVTGLAAGSQTFKLMATTGAATSSIVSAGNDYISFWIEDIGTA